ncbi:MAG: NACHT domain-containing protein [Pseudomonadota bacterium]|nr:NACHT domain-containing protein [Pseudomonadota bacterium]
MALLETAILSVGSGIAKGVFRYWLGSDAAPIQEHLWDNLIDVLKNKTSDVLAQRSADRQFQVIAEQSAKNVLDMVGVENRGIDEKRAEHIIEVAGKRINRAVADPSLIVENNIDPSMLSAYLISYGEVSGIEDTLNDDEKIILEEIIYEASQHIIDIASELPGFTEETFSEILKRENSILNQANIILEEISRLRESTKNIEAEIAAFENDFRRDVARKLDELQLFGVDVSNTSKRYKLSVAYVSLMVEEVKDKTKQERVKTEKDDDKDYPVAMNVEEALLKGERLLIRGAAGSGKTTLLQWISVTTASRCHKNDLEFLNECVPFFVRLRAVEKELPSPEDFVKISSPNIYGKMPHGWAHKKLENGSAIILVDGLDEVEESRRGEVKDWLKELTENFPKARYIISTRPHAAKEGWLDAEEFLEIEMQDMSSSDIQEFVKHWHLSVREVEISQDKKNQLIELEDKLKKTLQNNAALRRLATSPLLCALICALHRDRIENLPTRRVELYKACVDMFLRRDIERKIKSGNYPKIDETQKRTILQELSLWMMRGKLSQVSVIDADQRIELTLNSLQSIPSGVTGESVRKLFVERSGILREPTVDKIDFPHRTFQEYLAAQAALDDMAIQELISNAHDDQWQETIILAAGLARPAETNELISGLIRRGDEEEKYQHAIYLLAVAAQQGIVKLPEKSEIISEVKKRLKKVVPPRNITEAKALAAAGDLVVPYLRYSKQILKKAIPNIRCLSLIGTELAFRELDSYSNDNRMGVIEELEKCSKYVNDPVNFSQRYLYRHWFDFIDNDFTCDLENLSLSGKLVKDISLLENCHNLLNIDLSRTEVENITPLGNCKRIEFLDLSNTRVKDLSALSRCEKLKELDIVSTPSDHSSVRNISSLEILRVGYTPKIKITDYVGCEKLKKIEITHALHVEFDGVENLESLEEIYLRYVTEAELELLSKCKNLKSLTLEKCFSIDVTPLSNCVTLESLDLSIVKGLGDLSLDKLDSLRSLSLGPIADTDLSFLSNFQKLETLKLYGVTNDGYLIVSSLKNLEELVLVGGSVEIIPSLKDCNNLRILNLNHTSVHDLEPLSDCANLEELILSGSNVSDITPLSKLSNLISLDLFRTNVSDISALSSLSNLERLVLWDTSVEDISPLSNCQNLEFLDLDSTLVVDVTPISNCKKLETLYIRFTPIDNIGPISNLIENGLDIIL